MRGFGRVLVVAIAVVIGLLQQPGVAAGAWQVVAVPHATPADTSYSINGIWGSSGTDVWAVGVRSSGDIEDALLEHRGPNGWELATAGFPGHDITLNAVWGSAADDLWVVGHDFPEGGESTLFAAHYDGTSWSRAQLGETFGESGLNGVWGNAPDDVWAVGYRCDPSCDYPTRHRPLIVHFDGSSWSEVAEPPGYELTAVWGAATDDLWATDSTGFIDHYDGSTWRRAPAPSPHSSDVTFTLSSVWGNSATDIWVVGTRNRRVAKYKSCAKTLSEHFDGTTWRLVDTPNRRGCIGGELTAVWAAGQKAVWAVGFSTNDYGGQTLIEHRKGSTWRIRPSPTPGSGGRLASAWGTGGGEVWAGGEHLTRRGFVPLVEYRSRAAGV